MKSIAPTILKWTNQAATEWSGTGTTSNQVNPLIKMKTSAIIHWVQQKFSGQDIQLSEFSRQWVITLFSERLLICSLDYLKDLLLCWMLQLPNIFLVVPVVLCGFSLSIYLPFIPFIFWMTGIGNWIVSVLIGCTAGPLWAATHLGTSEDRGSRAAYGYIYLIDSMIRPPLMVFGFFCLCRHHCRRHNIKLTVWRSTS